MCGLWGKPPQIKMKAEKCYARSLCPPLLCSFYVSKRCSVQSLNKCSVQPSGVWEGLSDQLAFSLHSTLPLGAGWWWLLTDLQHIGLIFLSTGPVPLSQPGVCAPRSWEQCDAAQGHPVTKCHGSCGFVSLSCFPAMQCRASAGPGPEEEAQDQHREQRQGHARELLPQVREAEPPADLADRGRSQLGQRRRFS